MSWNNPKDHDGWTTLFYLTLAALVVVIVALSMVIAAKGAENPDEGGNAITPAKRWELNIILRRGPAIRLLASKQSWETEAECDAEAPALLEELGASLTDGVEIARAACLQVGASVVEPVTPQTMERRGPAKRKAWGI